MANLTDNNTDIPHTDADTDYPVWIHIKPIPIPIIGIGIGYTYLAYYRSIPTLKGAQEVQNAVLPSVL